MELKKQVFDTAEINRAYEFKKSIKCIGWNFGRSDRSEMRHHASDFEKYNQGVGLNFGRMYVSEMKKQLVRRRKNLMLYPPEASQASMEVTKIRGVRDENLVEDYRRFTNIVESAEGNHENVNPRTAHIESSEFLDKEVEGDTIERSNITTDLSKEKEKLQVIALKFLDSRFGRKHSRADFGQAGYEGQVSLARNKLVKCWDCNDGAGKH